MGNIINVACPLCGVAAQAEEHAAGRRLHYLCPNCHEFVISDMAIDWLQRRDTAARRVLYSEQSKKSTEESMFTIRRAQLVAGEPPDLEVGFHPLRTALSM